MRERRHILDNYCAADAFSLQALLILVANSGAAGEPRRVES
jgi:hypothetical protein